MAELLATAGKGLSMLYELGTFAMLPSMFAAGVYQGYKNEHNYNKTCKQIDDAEESLSTTLEKWKKMCSDQQSLSTDLSNNQEEILRKITGLRIATENVEKQYKQQIRTTEITLAIMIFIIIILLTIKRFQIVEKIIQIFK